MAGGSVRDAGGELVEVGGAELVLSFCGAETELAGRGGVSGAGTELDIQEKGGEGAVTEFAELELGGEAEPELGDGVDLELVDEAKLELGGGVETELAELEQIGEAEPELGGVG